MANFPKSYASVVNGGSSENTTNTPSKPKGRPKGTTKKSKSFKGTPKKNVTSMTPIIQNNDGLIGLVNVSSDCYFNSVIQVLFSLLSFRNHVQNFDPLQFYEKNHSEVIAVNHIKLLFTDMQRKLMDPLSTHEHLIELNLPEYVEHRQCDAQETMSFILDLFYPRIDDISNPFFILHIMIDSNDF